MKTISLRTIVLLIVVLTSCISMAAQESSADDNELPFEVNRVYPYITISQDQLNTAECLADLNQHYDPSWVSEYIRVEVQTVLNGKLFKSIGKSDILSPEQKDNMQKADEAADIVVDVHYIPHNTLSHNDPKQFEFSLTIDPAREAVFVGGSESMIEYIKDYAIDKIAEGTFEAYDLSVIKFSIDETGAVSNAHIFGAGYNASPDETIDQLLLETICNMPKWLPAEYDSGLKVPQDFVLIVGNTQNCMLNTLGTR